MTTDYTKQMQDMASAFTDQLKAAMPKVTFNKNGYEIRSEMLAMAQSQVWQDYQAKFAGWEQTVTRDAKTGEIIGSMSMPEVPGFEKVLEAAEKFYNFVNTPHTK
jgi:hypothetical protein